LAEPTSLLGQARAFARDFPRDRMPAGYLWNVVDYVPLIIDAGLTGRGGWQWGSDAAMTADVAAGVLASFSTGEKCLAITADKKLYEVGSSPPYTSTYRFATYTAKQNPMQWADTVIVLDGDGAAVPQLVTAPGGSLSLATMDASAPHAPLGTIYGAYVVVAGVPGQEQNVYFSYPNQPAHAWDSASVVPMSNRVTAIGSLRSVIIVFHPGSVERIRGSTPPATGQSNNDLIPEHLFDRVGCSDPKTVAYWNDNILFADEHGCHICDGAVIRNLVSQGSILYYWRVLWGAKATAAACTFLDYYIITVRRSDGSSDTLVCDLNKRQWFRFSNFYALSMFASAGGTGMERGWAGMAGTNRLARIGPMWFPTLGSALLQDDDGKPVLPLIETPWYRLGAEGRKRVKFAYLSYDARTTPGSGSELAAWRNGFQLEDAESAIPLVPPDVLATVAPVLELDYITSPSAQTYTTAGHFPPSTRYLRRKLPIRQAPYGVAFRVQQLQPTMATRLYDIAIEGQPLERSRL